MLRYVPSLSASLDVHHEKGVAINGESPGVKQTRDEVGVNHLPRDGVVFANKVAVHDKEGIALDGQCLGATPRQLFQSKACSCA